MPSSLKFDEAIARGLADAEAGRIKLAREVGKQLIAKYQAMAGPASRENADGFRTNHDSEAARPPAGSPKSALKN